MEPELTELEYVEQLLEDFDVGPNDKVRTLLQALEDDELEDDDCD